MFTASICTPMINVVPSASSSWHISMLWNISLLTDLKNTMIYCTVILAFKYMLWIAEISPPVNLTVRFAQNHRRLTSWHNLHWRSVWEWENRCKNDEECGVEGNKGSMRSSPQIPIIKHYPGDQKDLVVRRWERPKDPASTLAPNYSFSYYFCHYATLQEVCTGDSFTCRNTKGKIPQFHQGSCLDSHTNVSLLKITTGDFSIVCWLKAPPTTVLQVLKG